MTDEGVEKVREKQDLKKIDNYVILGDIVISENEKLFLSVHYKCRNRQKMSKVDIETEVTKLGIKHCYEKMNQGDEIEKMNDENIAEALKELDEEKQREKMERLLMSANDLNLGNIRPTELKYNTRVIPPVRATSISEAAITSQEEEVRRCLQNYFQAVVEDTVLTESEEAGRKSIVDRVKKKEILITFTDKDARVVVCKPDKYREAAKIHIEKDQEVDWTEVKPTINKMNKTAQQLVQMFNIGQNGSSSQAGRVNKAVICKDTAPPPISFL